MSRFDDVAPILEAHDLHKHFGGAVAVDSVSLDLRPGEIHAVVGENGAGKSTFMRMLAGILVPNEGKVVMDGQTLEPGSPQAALEAGISLVHQELSLIPEMTVAENIGLGSMPTKLGFIRRADLKATARDALDEIGVSVDLDEPVSRLSVALRQFVEIARAVARQPRVLILDEPTATLTPAETEYLLDMLKRLAERGLAIIYISHRIPEIFAICDTVTVLRDGKHIETVSIDDTSPQDLVDSMVGRELKHELETHREPNPGEVVLSARGVRAPGVNGIDLDVRAGEIVGIGGLVGAGRTEFVRAMLGADPRTAGVVRLTVGDTTTSITSYGRAVAAGVAYVPEERRVDGLALTMTVRENIALPNRKALSSALGVLHLREITDYSQRLADEVSLRPPEIKLEAGAYSGGNQQKVVVAKWLGREPDLIVLDEPTRGVDVGAKAEIHRLVRALADQGTAVLVISSDLPELLELSDVIHVVRDGKVVGVLPQSEADESSVMALAAGGTSLIGV
ncbi:MAG TPA: sugar ABC transporter ATP-binding protein [Nitriliruptoraceae bacterium]|nr:sugar ABC transporter ATP-binding protein [Nitriliruptoraceae bacterium]